MKSTTLKNWWPVGGNYYSVLEMEAFKSLERSMTASPMMHRRKHKHHDDSIVSIERTCVPVSLLERARSCDAEEAIQYTPDAKKKALRRRINEVCRV